MCVFNPEDLGSLRQAGHSGSVGQIGRALHDNHLPWHIQLDSVTQVLSLPSDKVSDIMTTVCKWLGRRTATKRELLSLIGKLFSWTSINILMCV